MMSRRAAVLKDFQSGYSCAQSIFTGYFDLYDGVEDREAALKVALPFGGGLACIQGVCGAVYGSVLLLGLKYGVVDNPADEEKMWEFNYLVRDFLKDFEEKNGSIYCKDIVRCDITTPEDLAKGRENIERYCVDAVLSAVDLLENKYKILEK